MATVYWAPFIKPSLVNEQGASLSLLNFSDPVKLVDELSKEKFYNTHIIKCSSFVQHIKNTYVIKSPIEVDLEINDENQYRSTLLDYNLNSYINIFDLALNFKDLATLQGLYFTLVNLPKLIFLRLNLDGNIT